MMNPDTARLTAETIVAIIAIVSGPTTIAAFGLRRITIECVPKGRRKLVELLSTTIISGVITYLYAYSQFLLSRENSFWLFAIWMGVVGAIGFGIYKVKPPGEKKNPQLSAQAVGDESEDEQI
jgi:hypothetical protein